jgi:hypothetical protein
LEIATRISGNELGDRFEMTGGNGRVCRKKLGDVVCTIHTSGPCGEKGYLSDLRKEAESSELLS